MSSVLVERLGLGAAAGAAGHASGPQHKQQAFKALRHRHPSYQQHQAQEAGSIRRGPTRVEVVWVGPPLALQ